MKQTALGKAMEVAKRLAGDVVGLTYGQLKGSSSNIHYYEHTYNLYLLI